MHIGDIVGNLGELRECHDTNANRRRAAIEMEMEHLNFA
jgi:hypothetical protein